MRIGIADKVYRSFFSAEELYPKMRAHGFDCADYSPFTNPFTPFFSQDEADFLRAVEKDRRMAEDAGISFWQSHGPWIYPPRNGTEEERALWRTVTEKAIRGTAALGCPHMVLHVIMPFGPGSEPDTPLFHAMNREFFLAILEEAHRYNVTLCLENLPMTALSLSAPAQVYDFVRDIGDERLKICLDTGHATVCGVQPADALRQAGKMICTLHVHDNDGRADRHEFPFFGVVDWADFTTALAEVAFDGVVSIESRLNRKVPTDIAEGMLVTLARMARRIGGEA